MPYSLYPSVQAMRHLDRPQTPNARPALTTYGLQARENGVKESEMPPVYVHDFQDQHRSVHAPFRGRAKSTTSATTSVPTAVGDLETAPPVPDLSQRAIHVPTRTSSRNGARRSPHESSISTTPASIASSADTYETNATSMMLPALQAKGPPDELDQLEPLLEDDPQSFDLVMPAGENHRLFSLETRSQQLFSREHLEVIFADPALLLKFTAYLSTHRPQSVPILIYYLDALKALKAIAYANAVAAALEPIAGYEFTLHPARATVNSTLEEKAAQAFNVLVRDDLPAYITHIYIQVVSLSITRRITGTLAPHLRDASEGLAEVFCLSDPSRPDNPIVFASEEFHRTTQYGMSYAIGRNCRFLQGPRTNPLSVRRIREALDSGREHCEVFLNYRRDGSPFMNLLMVAPLCDSRGKLRYFIGAQVDVSGMAKQCTDLESLQRLVMEQEGGNVGDEVESGNREKKDEFRQLSEMLNAGELETARRWGGRMHREHQDEDDDTGTTAGLHKPRLLLKDHGADVHKAMQLGGRVNGRLSGVYQHYLLVRPHPSLRVLFASPSLRVPGILQSPFMNKIGGSARVRDELTAAMAEGRGVTAKVRWVSRTDEEGRNRWIHCTPLLGSNGQIGVWMIVLVDDEKELSRRWKQAPPVNPSLGRAPRPEADERGRRANDGDPFPGGASRSRSARVDAVQSYNDQQDGGSQRSASPYSLRIE